MTPLAYRIVKQSWLPLKHRETFEDMAELLKWHEMDDIHCFEVSSVFDLMDELGMKWHSAMIGADGQFTKTFSVEKTFAFLPAPKTWIEWRGNETEKGYRFGVLLKEVDGLALCTFADGVEGQYLRSIKQQLVLALRTHEWFEIRLLPNVPEMSRAWQMTILLRLYAALALINSPKVIGRVQHTPHRTLNKQFAGGKFPLHDWTEIRLEVNKPPEIDDGEPHEARLTGRRALHFCRAHIRIRLGKLEYVVAHWRGDASIGIRQSRYVAVQDHRGAAWARH